MPGTVRRVVLGGGIAAGLGLCGPTAGVAGEFPAPAVRTDGFLTTITVHVVESGSGFTGAAGGTGSEAGDTFSATALLSQTGVAVGTSSSTCVYEEAESYMCSITYAFSAGSLTARGLVARSDPSVPLRLAITSGTGDYRGASGKLDLVFHGGDSADATLSYVRAGAAAAELPMTTQVEVVPAGGADTGGGGTARPTDSPLLIGIGVAALAGAAGLFATAHYAARRH